MQIIPLLTSLFLLGSVEAATDSYGTESPAPTPMATEVSPGLFGELRTSTAMLDDFEIGGRFGFEPLHGRVPLNLFFDFDARPYRRAVRVRESSTLEYQFQENRFTSSLGVATRIPVRKGSDAYWTLATGLGWSLGTYSGAYRDAEVTFPAWVETGIRFRTGSHSYLGLAYQYFPLPDVLSHRVLLQWGMRKPWGDDR